jgi:uncharacterized protein (TIGR00296 family)
MVAMLSQREGLELISIARKAIEEYLAKKTLAEPSANGALAEKRGVFVTLKEKGELRGCIGFPHPTQPLAKATAHAAVSAAVNDPRFGALRAEELRGVTIEVSVLTQPEQLDGKPDDYPKRIKIGRDGLVVEYGPYAGLLLPQVATEQRWNAEQFLCATCAKAGLSPASWMDGARVSTFAAQVFTEKPGKTEQVV